MENFILVAGFLAFVRVILVWYLFKEKSKAKDHSVFDYLLDPKKVLLIIPLTGSTNKEGLKSLINIITFSIYVSIVLGIFAIIKNGG